MNEIKNIETSVKSVFEINPKQLKHFSKFEKLLSELEKKELTQDVVFKINHEVEKVNTIRVARKENPVLLKKANERILKSLREDLKIVPKNYYTNLWLALGISSFGIPLGVVFGLSLNNMAFLGMGIPIGMALGIAIGKSLDNKAFQEGKSLNLEI